MIDRLQVSILGTCIELSKTDTSDKTIDMLVDIGNTLYGDMLTGSTRDERRVEIEKIFEHKKKKLDRFGNT